MDEALRDLSAARTHAMILILGLKLCFLDAAMDKEESAVSSFAPDSEKCKL
jgi:hypothetical protein